MNMMEHVYLCIFHVSSSTNSKKITRSHSPTIHQLVDLEMAACVQRACVTRPFITLALGS